MVGLEDFHGIHCDSVAVYVRQSHLQARKSNMAAKNQDGGRKFLFLSTKKLSKVLKNYHTKNGAWSQSVTGISTIASTNFVIIMIHYIGEIKFLSRPPPKIVIAFVDRTFSYSWDFCRSSFCFIFVQHS